MAQEYKTSMSIYDNSGETYVTKTRPDCEEIVHDGREQLLTYQSKKIFEHKNPGEPVIGEDNDLEADSDCCVYTGMATDSKNNPSGKISQDINEVNIKEEDVQPDINHKDLFNDEKKNLQDELSQDINEVNIREEKVQPDINHMDFHKNEKNINDDPVLIMEFSDHSDNENCRTDSPTLWIETEDQIFPLNFEPNISVSGTQQVDPGTVFMLETKSDQQNTCKVCRETFDNVDDFIEHTRLHSFEGIHTCEHCDKQFIGLSRLKEHMLSHCGTKLSFTCRICKETFISQQKLKQHSRVHIRNRKSTLKRRSTKSVQKVRKQDAVCKIQSISETSERKTLRTKVNPKSRNQMLKSNPVKVRNIKRSKKLCKPKAVKKKTKSTYATDKTKINPVTVEKKPKKTYPCEYCGKIWTTSSHLKGHLIKHTGIKPHQCEICGKSYVRKIALTEHMSLHAGIKPYTCELCHKGFATKDSFKYHAWEHDGIRPFTCEICGKSFIRRSHLNEHTRTHSDDKPFECDICVKKFWVKKSLKIHQMSHFGKKDLLCSVCGKQYNVLDRLKRHELKHKHVCKVCGECFKNGSELRTHMEVSSHIEVKTELCEKCGKEFKYRYIKRHQKTCEGVKQFKCQHCEAVFSNSTLLSAHKMVHDDDHTHQCEYCGKYFKIPYRLKRHLNRVHKVNVSQYYQ